MPRDHDAGFTIVELLVALSVLSMLLTMMLVTYRYTSRTAILVDGDSKRIEELSLSRRILSELLTQVIVSQPTTAAFHGSERHMSFLTRAPRQFAQADPIRTTLSAGTDGGGMIAVWKLPDGHEIERSLLAGQRIRFSYLLEPGNWTGEWGQTGRLPLLVRLQIERPDGSRRLDIVEPVRAVVPEACATLRRPQSLCGS